MEAEMVVEAEVEVEAAEMGGGGVRSGMAQGTEVQEVAQGFRCDMMRT